MLNTFTDDELLRNPPLDLYKQHTEARLYYVYVCVCVCVREREFFS